MTLSVMGPARGLQRLNRSADSSLTMTSKDAITAHVNWKLRIHALLSSKSSEKLEAATIARDNVCELGKWIHGEGRTSVPKLMHAELMSTHADFHREAARIVSEVSAGRPIGLEAIAPDSPFGKLTTRIVGMLSRLSIG